MAAVWAQGKDRQAKVRTTLQRLVDAQGPRIVDSPDTGSNRAAMPDTRRSILRAWLLALLGFAALITIPPLLFDRATYGTTQISLGCPTQQHPATGRRATDLPNPADRPRPSLGSVVRDGVGPPTVRGGASVGHVDSGSSTCGVRRRVDASAPSDSQSRPPAPATPRARGRIGPADHRRRCLGGNQRGRDCPCRAGIAGSALGIAPDAADWRPSDSGSSSNWWRRQCCYWL